MTIYLVPFGSHYYGESRDDDYVVLSGCPEGMQLHSVPIQTSSWTCKDILAVPLSMEELKLMSSETLAQLEEWGTSKPDLWFIDETKDHPMRLLILGCLIKDWPEYKDFFQAEFGEQIDEGKDEKLILSMEENIRRWESEIPHKNNLLKRLFAKRQLEEYLKGRFLDTKSEIFPELDLDLIDSRYGYEGWGDESCLKHFLEEELGIKATPVFVYADGALGCIPELGNADYFTVKKYGKDEVVLILEETGTYNTDFSEISLPLDLWEEAMKIGAVILL